MTDDFVALDFGVLVATSETLTTTDFNKGRTTYLLHLAEIIGLISKKRYFIPDIALNR